MDLLTLQPKINTNRRKKKVSKYKKEKILNDWKLNRAKETEEWRKEEVLKKLEILHSQGKRRKIIGSKYVKHKVSRNKTERTFSPKVPYKAMQLYI